MTVNRGQAIARGRHWLLESLRDVDDWIHERARRTRILFVFSDPYGFACQAPIIPHLLSNAGVEVRVVWDRSNKQAEGGFCSAQDEDLFKRLRMDPGEAAWRKWHIVVDSHLCSFYPKRRALRAYLHHGAGFGSGGGVAAAEACQVYLGVSQAERGYLEARRPGLFDTRHAFFPVGFPKADALLDGTFERKAILERLGLPDRRTILITSHYTPGSTLRALGSGVLRLVAEHFPDCNVIQTGHPWLWRQGSGADEEWRKALRAELDETEACFRNVRLVTDMLAEPLAAASDLLISDYSSALTTFGLLDRPIVFYANPDVARMGRAAFQYYCNAAHIFTDLPNLVQACAAAMREPDAMASGRKALRDAFYAHAGNSAELTADVLRSIGPVCSVSSPRWNRVMALAETHMERFSRLASATNAGRQEPIDAP